MSRKSARILILALIVLAVAALAQVVIAVEGLTLDDLSTTKIGNFPKRWRTWPLQRGDAEKVYRVAEEGGKRFIKAYDSEDLSQQIFLNFNWQVQERPMLSWRWRVTKLPEGAAESNDATNDSACGVYVVVGKYSGHAIKYVWSSSLPAGNVTTRHDGKLKIKVLDSGQARTGSWVAHSVDVRTDYESLFGKPLEKNPSGIGMLTDGNAVHKPSGCDYADFAISGKGQ